MTEGGGHVTETRPGVVEWGVATRALPGEEESGDLHVVKQRPDGALVVAIDGLGHGPEAALAARQAADIVESSTHARLADVFDACHRGLRNTRGVVMSAANIDAGLNSLEWMGVGNIEGTLLHADGARHETIMLFGGIAGHQMPNLRASRTELRPGDTLVFATDGVASRYATGLDLGRAPQDIADHVLLQHNKGSDDALVLVVRYIGRSV